MYEIYVEKSAEGDLRRLPASIFRRIINGIRALSQDPRPSGCRKIVGSKNDWRIRIGSYRILYEIDERNKVVRIMRIRHRREAYR